MILEWQNMKFLYWLDLFESAQENEALIILDRDPLLLNKAKELVPHNKFLPAAAVFIKQNPDTDKQELQDLFKSYAEMVDKKKLNMVYTKKFATGGLANYKLYIKDKSGTEQELDFSKLADIVHAVESEELFAQQKSAAKQYNAQDFGKPTFSNDKVSVYESNSPQLCIKHGIGTSFCISQPGRSLFQTYRYGERKSTFYFVFDKTRKESDPLSIVVVDIDENGKPLLTDRRNTTGSIEEFNRHSNSTDEGKLANALEYMQYLKDNLGVDLSIFKSIAHTDEETAAHKKLSSRNTSLDWFKNLTNEEKVQYISYGHVLTNEQFNFVRNYMPSLLERYINVGTRLPDEQLEVLFKNAGWKKTYLRQRLQRSISTTLSDLRLGYYEYSNLSPEQQTQVTGSNYNNVLIDSIKLDNGIIEKILAENDQTEAAKKLIEIFREINSPYRKDILIPFLQKIAKYGYLYKLFPDINNDNPIKKIEGIFSTFNWLLAYGKSKFLEHFKRHHEFINKIGDLFGFKLSDMGYLLVGLLHNKAPTELDRASNNDKLKKYLLNSITKIEKDNDQPEETASLFEIKDFYTKWFGTNFFKKMLNVKTGSDDNKMAHILLDRIVSHLGGWRQEINYKKLIDFVKEHPEYKKDVKELKLKKIEDYKMSDVINHLDSPNEIFDLVDLGLLNASSAVYAALNRENSLKKFTPEAIIESVVKHKNMLLQAPDNINDIVSNMRGRLTNVLKYSDVKTPENLLKIVGQIADAFKIFVQEGNAFNDTWFKSSLLRALTFNSKISKDAISEVYKLFPDTEYLPPANDIISGIMDGFSIHGMAWAKDRIYETLPQFLTANEFLSVPAVLIKFIESGSYKSSQDIIQMLNFLIHEFQIEKRLKQTNAREPLYSGLQYTLASKWLLKTKEDEKNLIKIIGILQKYYEGQFGKDKFHSIVQSIIDQLKMNHKLDLAEEVKKTFIDKE